MLKQTSLVVLMLAFVASTQGLSQSCFYPESTKLVPSLIDAGAEFGSAVAVDGIRAVVGAPREDTVAGASAGTAYIYEQVGGAWIETARLTASDGQAGAFFGASVAISGTRAAIGAMLDDPNGLVDAGSVHIFEKESGTWGFKQKLKAADASAGSMFGVSLALESDQIAIGSAGYCYVFERLFGNWFQTGKLSLGNFPLVDIEPDRIIASGLTSANIYEKQGAAWTFVKTLQGSGPVQNAAARVSLSGDRAVVSSGDWRVYVRQGGNWSLEFSIDNAGDYASVAISGDTIAIGFLVGHLQVWQRSQSGWNVSLTMETTDGVNNGSYFSSALAVDGHVAVVGAPKFGATQTGRAYIMDTSPPFAPYGSGCPGTGGFVPQLSLNGCVIAGGSANLDVWNGPGGSIAAVLLGLGPDAVPIGGGCSLLLSGVFPQTLLLPLFGVGPGGGAISISAALPADLLAGSIAIQAFVADAAIAQGFTSTNGVVLTAR